MLLNKACAPLFAKGKHRKTNNDNYQNVKNTANDTAFRQAGLVGVAISAIQHHVALPWFCKLQVFIPACIRKQDTVGPAYYASFQRLQLRHKKRSGILTGNLTIRQSLGTWIR